MNTQFKKGTIPWNKGTKGICISNSGSFKKGKHSSLTTELKKGNRLRLGKKHSELSKKKISDSKKGKPSWNKGISASWALGNKYRLGIPSWNKGLKGYMSGTRNCNWRGGVTSIHEKIRKSSEYEEWRDSVVSRDSWRCVKCGAVQSRKVKIVADHIKPFTLFPELRFIVENGRTLCKPCDNKYGFKWNRHVSWDENFKRYQLTNSNKID
jgi:hypothetical protein